VARRRGAAGWLAALLDRHYTAPHMVAFFLASGGDARGLCERASSELPPELLGCLGEPRPPNDSDAWCRVDFGAQPVDVVEWRAPDRAVLLVGYLTEPRPVAANVEDPLGALAAVVGDGTPLEALAGRLNGSFALVEWRRGRGLTVLTDRFGSRMLYVARLADSWAVASEPSLLWHASGGRLGIDPAALGSLLVRSAPAGGRLLFDVGRRCTAGRLDRFADDGEEQSTVWYEPVYAPTSGRSTRAWANDLVDALRGSAKRLQPLMARPVLFLSGGMDSRLALAALKDHPGLRAVTLGARPNVESRVAQAAAAAVGVPWSLGGSEERWTLDTLDHAATAFGALYSPLEAHFGGYLQEAAAQPGGPDSALLGDFLEAFAKLLGSSQAASIPASASTCDLVDGIARLDKEFPPDMIERMGALLRPEVRDQVLPAWRADLTQSLEEALALTPTRPLALDLLLRWREAPTVLTFGMIQDVRSRIAERSLSMCTQMHDLMLSMPGDVRDSGRLHPLALQRLAPSLALLPDANTMLPAGTPKALRSWVAKTRFRVGRLRRKTAVSAGRVERRTAGSWPSVDVKAVLDPVWRARFEDVINDPSAIPPDLFDLDAVQASWKRFADGDGHEWRPVVNLLAFGQAHRRFGDGSLA
jgi:hypothetical protein